MSKDFFLFVTMEEGGQLLLASSEWRPVPETAPLPQAKGTTFGLTHLVQNVNSVRLRNPDV